MNNRLLNFLTMILLATPVFGQSFDNGFDFNLPWDDTATAEFLPRFPHQAIGQGDRVSVDSAGNFIVRGQPYRFFGGNLTTQGAFPRKEDAEKIAGRMRKYGINLVRFHHIDNPWSDGSLFHNTNSTREFNAEMLDRLDYLIYQLKEHGIYVNMNLHVSRTFRQSDGVADADSIDRFGKGITQFDPHLVMLQKEYAGMLLGHTNPYTGTPLATDPVLAMVEIINENSLFRMWYSDDLKAISAGGKLPVYYLARLDSLWHDFLKAKYDSTAGLALAWNRGSFSGDTLFFDDFHQEFRPEWKLELQQTAAASRSIVTDTASGNSFARVSITATSSENWHTQFKYVGASVRKDSIYEVVVKVRADEPKELKIHFQRDNSPWTYYGGQTCQIDTGWQEIRAVLKAPEDNHGYLRINFGFQHQLGNFYFDDFLFKSESKLGLTEDESIKNRSVRRLNRADLLRHTVARVMDNTGFYTKIQVAFLKEMSSYLRDSLNVTAPITGTNWFTGPEDVNVQNTLDYIDNHSYWDHPQFPNQPWSPTDWKINNTPMLTSGSGTIENLFNGLVIHRKPFTLSEYNHPFPNQYQSELLPLITSYLSYNDADGFMIFTYSSSWNWKENRISGFFDVHRNSNLMANLPVFSYAFRNFLIPANREPFVIRYSKEDIYRMPLSITEWWKTHYPYSGKLCYRHRLEMSPDHDTDFDFSTLPEVPESPYLLNEGEIYWDKNGLLKINTPQFASITGYLNNYPGTETEAMAMVAGSDFGSVTWLSLVDSSLEESSRSLLAFGTKMNNTGMIWDGNNTVHNNWGGEPALVYPLQVTLKLKTTFSHMRITPLDARGKAIAGSSDTLAADSSGFVTAYLDQYHDKTLWYGIEAMNDTEPEIPQDTTGIHKVLKGYSLRCYPNPAGESVQFEFAGSPAGHETILEIYDLAGTVVSRHRISGDMVLSTGSLARGTYLYRFRNDRFTQTGKIVLQ